MLHYTTFHGLGLAVGTPCMPYCIPDLLADRRARLCYHRRLLHIDSFVQAGSVAANGWPGAITIPGKGKPSASASLPVRLASPPTADRTPRQASAARQAARAKSPPRPLGSRAVVSARARMASSSP